MTTIRFSGPKGRPTGFVCRGHSGYGEAGEDIVCAAVSSAVTLAECIINDVYRAGARVSVDAETAEIELMLPGEGEEPSRGVLQGLLMQMKELSSEYPDHLTVMEV